MFVTPLASPLLRAGERIADRYRVDRVVRRGGLSVLLAARDLRTGRPVALKVVAIDPNDRGIRQRLVREVAILRQLKHPRIVRCFDAGDLSPMKVYLVLEWLEGEDLAEAMLKAPMSLRTVLEVVEQVAEALQAAHAEGIIHRDIKPANIFIMRGGDPLDCRVLDFGVAKVPFSGSGTITQTGAILGTPNYMAPEQANYAMTVDGRADLYSLGVVAFELISRRLPFKSGTDLARLANILTEDALPATRVVPELPASAAELIDGLLVREAHGRIATAEAAAALARGSLSALPSDVLDRVYPSVDVPDDDPDFMERSVVRPVGTVPLVEAHPTDDAEEVDLDPTPVEMSRLFVGGSLADDLLSADEGTHASLLASGVFESTDSSIQAEPDTAALSIGDLDFGETLIMPVATVLTPEAAWDGIAADIAPWSPPASGRCYADFDADTPMVGRRGLLDRIVQRLAGAIDSVQPILQLIVGPGGIGKTRLCAETVHRIAGQGEAPVVFAARAEEERRRVPFDFVRRVIFALADVDSTDSPEAQTHKVLGCLPSPADVQRLLAESQPLRAGLEADPERDPHEHAVLAGFVAEALGLLYPDTAPVIAARGDPMRSGQLMADALAVILRRVAGLNGLVVVIDDVQWLDGGSGRVLRTLLASEHPIAFAVAGFGAPTLLDPDVRSGWSLSGLGPAEAITQIGPLPPPDARAFAEALLPAPAREVDIEGLIQRSAGNALYLEQLILALIESGQWQARAGRMQWKVTSKEAVYPTVASAISARISQRSSASQRVITAAACFGQIFWAEGVAHLTGLPLDEVMTELADLAAYRWCRRRKPSRYPHQEEFEFTHGAIAAVAVARLKRRRRESFEALVDVFLVGVGEREPAVLAPHRAAAGDSCAQTYLAGAERALRLGDPLLAAQLAEDGAAQQDGEDGPIATALHSVLEEAALATGDWALGVGALHAQEAEEPTVQADLACRRCRLALKAQRLDDARSAADEGAAIVEQAGLSGPWMAQVQLHQAEVAERAGDRRAALRLFGSARRGLEGQPEWSDALARATAGLARSALRAVDYATAENRFRAALVHARARYHAEQIVEAYEGLVEVARQRGDLRTARAFAAEAVRADAGSARAGRARLLRGAFAAEMGRWTEAQALIERAVSERESPEDALWMRALVALSQLYRWPADRTEGLARERARLLPLQRALASAVEVAAMVRPEWGGGLALAQATVARALGAPDAAAAERAQAQFESEGAWSGDEPASIAFGLARLWMNDTEYIDRGRAYLRRAIDEIDAVVGRLAADERPRYLNRPSINIIMEQAERAL